jgi:hypothetical protein
LQSWFKNITKKNGLCSKQTTFYNFLPNTAKTGLPSMKISNARASAATYKLNM